jgi:S1-C subfamily serine protease
MVGVRGRGRRTERRLTIGAVGLLLLAVVLALLIGRLGLSRSAAAPTPALPGATVEADPTDAAPVITSLQSNGVAERRGVQVGDRIAAVDGQPVPDIAAFRAAVARHGGRQPVALHIQRGAGLWTVTIPRRDPASADEQDAPSPIP